MGATGFRVSYGGNTAIGGWWTMDQTVHNARHGAYRAMPPGDLDGLLATLDRPEDAAPLDAGLQRLVTSLAVLRRNVDNRV